MECFELFFLYDELTIGALNKVVTTLQYYNFHQNYEVITTKITK
jgi:hypothetical protein